MKRDAGRKIDAALHRLAQVQPEPGLEGRIRARLDQESARIRKSPSARLRKFFFEQRIAFAAASAAVGCVVIVIGSVQHSRQKALEGAMPASGIHLAAPESGVGAASGTHISPQPIAAPEHGRARSERSATSGRATVSKDAHKPSGVAVPESPEPQKP
ncbi:MAG TPA: hypothetical protein VHT24_09020 [Pseudacidobacterium sp.]|jgi:hypothetical protein|nr:hypothetical protein [Pseudacidobacterium sp.]